MMRSVSVMAIPRAPSLTLLPHAQDSGPRSIFPQGAYLNVGMNCYGIVSRSLASCYNSRATACAEYLPTRMQRPQPLPCQKQESQDQHADPHHEIDCATARGEKRRGQNVRTMPILMR